MNKLWFTIILILFSLGGIYYFFEVASNIEDNADENWKRASIEYKCSYDQFAKVMMESNYCRDTTRFTGRYCYSAAIIRNCSKN